VIIQATRSEAWKGHAALLEALTTMADDRRWVWWQVGGAQRPPERAFLDALRASAEEAHLLDRIRWVGERTDVPRLLAAADIYCQANTKPEPFGVVFVEALAAGRPVVTTALGAAPEIVNDSCGILVPPNDPDALARSLRRLIDDPAYRRQLGAGAPRRAQQLCDPVTQIGRVNDLIAAMVAPARS
jgi:glycosyltransferase involved in cell wall biosynthesis